MICINFHIESMSLPAVLTPEHKILQQFRPVTTQKEFERPSYITEFI